MFKKIAVYLLGSLPTIAVLGLLGFVGYWGHAHHWRWLATTEENAEKKPDENGDSTPPAKYVDKDSPFDRFDTTLPITHDPATCKYIGQDIPFKDEEHIYRSGIRLGKVEMRSMQTTISVPAVTEFDPTRVARIAPRVGGVLCQMEKQVGDQVRPGELLAVVDSLDVGKAKAALIQAKMQFQVRKQSRSIMKSGVVPEVSIAQADFAVREAEVNLYAAHQSLLNLGFTLSMEEIEKESDRSLGKRLQYLDLPKSVIDTMPGEGTANLLPIFNPLKHPATVLQREGLAREPVAALQTLYMIGETNELVVYMDVRQEQARTLRIGLPVQFTPDGELNASVAATIDWISTEADPKTRTVRMRGRLPNAEGKLKAKLFGTARITLSRPEPVLSVPEEAVQWDGCSHIVFVLEEKKTHEAEKENGDPKKEEDEKKKYGDDQLTFKVRRVKLGMRQERFIEITEGSELKAGDTIAVLGSHVLKSYLFRDRIGSGDD